MGLSVLEIKSVEALLLVLLVALLWVDWVVVVGELSRPRHSQLKPQKKEIEKLSTWEDF